MQAKDDEDKPAPSASDTAGVSDDALNPEATAAKPSVSDPVEETHSAMLDVHPPHEAIHTWKGFFIHIATITIGLLIAVGIEQSVEFFHHRHQRQHLEEDLHEEGLRNRELVERDLLYLRSGSAWLMLANRATQSSMAHRTSPERWPPSPNKDETRKGYFAVTASVWETAKESGTIALLPRSEALVYTRLYRVHDLVIATDLEWRKASAVLLGTESRFLSSADAAEPNLGSMSDAQLDQLSASLMQLYGATRSLMSLISAYRGANEAVLHGVKNEDEMLEFINSELQHREYPSSNTAAPKSSSH